MRTDIELFEAWQAGDAMASNALFQRHFSSISRFFANKLYSDVDVRGCCGG